MPQSPQNPPQIPIVPVQLGLDDTFQFQCHKGIACFNKCCENIDIQLTPYDILRLKRRFGITARELIDRSTRDFAMDGQGLPGLKLATKENSTACIHLTPAGCGVYSDRPAACRYYALGTVKMRKKDSPAPEDFYFVVKEEHCLGHREPKVQTIREYHKDQGIEDYDAANREWQEIIVKKRSSGPTVGRPSERSLELFFLASYDIDGFREFVASAGFAEVFDLDPALRQNILNDDATLLQFGSKLLKQVLFGEMTIPLKPDARAKRIARYRERMAQQGSRAEQIADAQDKLYESLDG